MNPPKWELQKGLPAYGPAAEPFSDTGQGTHREGLVVKFLAPAGSWIGNFQRGPTSLDEVFAHPDGQHAVVVAGGTVYVIDSEDRRLVANFGGAIEHIIFVPQTRCVVFGNGLWFEAIGPEGMTWRSKRISWDGMRHVSLDGATIRGEAYAPEGPNGVWYAFEVDTTSGSTRGGSYTGPM